MAQLDERYLWRLLLLKLPGSNVADTAVGVGSRVLSAVRLRRLPH